MPQRPAAAAVESWNKGECGSEGSRPPKPFALLKYGKRIRLLNFGSKDELFNAALDAFRHEGQAECFRYHEQAKVWIRMDLLEFGHGQGKV